MTREELIQLATRARDSAYAPYSKFQVGSALVLNDGRSFSGVNVENCSYGLTLCAERNAITSAVSHGAKPGDISHIVIVAHSPGWPSPCGACRQVMSEFMPRDAKVSPGYGRQSQHAKLEVAGVSVITNRAAGLSATPLSHAEVKEVGAMVEGPLCELLSRVVSQF